MVTTIVIAAGVSLAVSGLVALVFRALIRREQDR